MTSIPSPSCASAPFTANLSSRSVTWSWHSPRYSELMTRARSVDQIATITRDFAIEFFVVVGEPKTQARMQHLLRTGKPLRN